MIGKQLKRWQRDDWKTAKKRWQRDDWKAAKKMVER